MLFEYLKAITCTKKDNLPLEEYVPYLINRWLTFGITGSTTALNETVNCLGNLDKSLHFKLLLSLFPKHNRFPKFQYIKKIKKENITDDTDVKLLSQSLELSTKEINELIKTVELFNKTE
jgi:hypothetical protein